MKTTARAEPSPRPRFRRRRRAHEPLELDLGQNLTETVANRALDFARVVGGHRSGEGSRTKRNFDQEPRGLALVDHGFETRMVLDQHRGTSSWGRKRRGAHWPERACARR